MALLDAVRWSEILRRFGRHWGESVNVSDTIVPVVSIDGLGGVPSAREGFVSGLASAGAGVHSFVRLRPPPYPVDLCILGGLVAGHEIAIRDSTLARPGTVPAGFGVAYTYTEPGVAPGLISTDTPAGGSGERLDIGTLTVAERNTIANRYPLPALSTPLRLRLRPGVDFYVIHGTVNTAVQIAMHLIEHVAYEAPT